jgi:hypothetical protein
MMQKARVSSARENVLQVLPVEDLAEVFDRAESVLRTFTGNGPLVPSIVTEVLVGMDEDVVDAWDYAAGDALEYELPSCTIFGIPAERAPIKRGFAGLLDRLRAQRVSWATVALLAPVMLVVVFMGSVALGRAAASAETVTAAHP